MDKRSRGIPSPLEVVDGRTFGCNLPESATVRQTDAPGILKLMAFLVTLSDICAVLDHTAEWAEQIVVIPANSGTVVVATEALRFLDEAVVRGRQLLPNESEEEPWIREVLSTPEMSLRFR